MMLLRIVLGGAALLVLAVLPGAWVTFNRSARELGFWDRLWCASAVAPLIVAAQFHVLAIAGVPFALNAVLVVLINLPAAWLILRHGGPVPIISRREALLVAGLSAIPIAFCAMSLATLQYRGFAGHGWLHSDIIYQIANGSLRPEEPTLAGVRLSYPWLLHIQAALQMFVLDEAPVSGFTWIDAVFLVTVAGLTWSLVAQLGGDVHARVWGIMLLFGLNFVGYTLRKILPEAATNAFSIWGDWRYTPWMRKYLVFGPMAAALPMFGAMLVIAVRDGKGPFSPYRYVVLGLMIGSIGVMYPLLFPAAIGILGGMGAVQLLQLRGADRLIIRRRFRSLVFVAAIALVATVAVAAWTTVDRSSGIMVELSTRWAAMRKAAESVVVLLPLLLGAAAMMWQRRREVIGPHTVLVLAGLGSIFLHVVFHIPHDDNEYKYMMTAAMALSPPAGVAVAAALRRIRRFPITVLTVLGALLLAAPAFHRRMQSTALALREPVLAGRGFELRIVGPEPLASAVEAIRTRTPHSTIVVATDRGLHLPTVTSRPLYAPYADVAYPGVNILPEHLLIDIRGYPSALLEDRRRTLKLFFGNGSDQQRRGALRSMQALARPLAIVVDEAAEGHVSAWLDRVGEAELIYQERGLTVWLLPAARDGRLPHVDARPEIPTVP